MPRPALAVEVRDGVLLLTIDRPEVRNAVNGDVTERMAAALDHLDTDDDLSVAVLTGSGGFCSGMDLGAFVAGESVWHPERGFAGIVRRTSRKPVVAAIERFAVAGGLEIALACDLIVAADDAILGIPEARRGLVAAGGGAMRLPRRVPYHVAMEMALTGEPVPARRLYELGLLNRVTRPGGALDAALELAVAISRNAPLAVAAGKRVIEAQRDWHGNDEWARHDEITDPVIASEDAREGARAFKERRPPVWRGR